MNNNLLSIIIPHYNSSDTLEKLLASIPNKEEIQVIVVDDYSEKQHLDEIAKLKDKYSFEFYENDGVKSAGTCRNIGIDKAIGDWVLFADSDDYFVENFYDSVSKYFESDYEVVHFYATSIFIDSGEQSDRHKGIENYQNKYLKNQSKKNEISLKYNISSPVCKLISRDLIINNNIKFDEVLTANDVMFSAKVGYYMKRFTVDSGIIYCITKNSKSITSRIDIKSFDIRKNVRINKILFLEERLSKLEFNAFDPKLLEILLPTLINFGPKRLIQVIKELREQKIKWFYWNYLSPSTIYLLIKKFIFLFKNKRYQSK